MSRRSSEIGSTENTVMDVGIERGNTEDTPINNDGITGGFEDKRKI